MRTNIIQRIICIFGFHGPTIGGVEIVEYNNEKRLFFYRAFLKCKYCHKEMENETTYGNG